MAKIMKTKRAAAKRFKLTATGKIKYKKSHLRHLLSNKSKSAKKDKNRPGYVALDSNYVVSNGLKHIAKKLKLATVNDHLGQWEATF